MDRWLSIAAGWVSMVSMVVVIAVATSASPVAARGGEEDPGNQWNHHKENEQEIITCRMHGVEEVTGSSNPCTSAAGDLFTSEQSYCVTLPHTPGDYGNGYVPSELHTVETGCDIN